MTAPLVIPYFIPHQGCPHQCIFCNQSIITAQNNKSVYDLDRVIQKYLAFKGNRSRVELAFFGGNFLGLPVQDIKTLLDRVRPYLEKGLIHGLRCSTRPDTITEERLNLVTPYGLGLVELGVQSMDNKVLGQAGRGHTREDTLRAVKQLQEASIQVGVQVMAGLPGDTRSAALETVQVLAALKPDLARIYPVLVLAGSRLARWYETGRYAPLTLDRAVDQVKDMAKVFNAAGVPVVRMGLQASEMMDDASQVLAGPWHPAFGHLVFAALMFERACEQIDSLVDPLVDRVLEKESAVKIALTVHPRSISRLQGNKKNNLEKLSRRYPGRSFSIQTCDKTGPDQVVATSLP